MENHSLAIGTMKTACKVVAYPQAVLPLRACMERAVGGPFQALLSKSLEPVLGSRDGVIRIRELKLDLFHSGEWDEAVLARLIASKLAAALASLLDSSPVAVRIWPDHDAYMASFIEYKLGLAHEPDWAFPELAPLRFLAPEQAAAEVLKSRLSVFGALTWNGRRVGNPHRIASRLGTATAADIVSAWVQVPNVLAQLAASGFDEAELAKLVLTNAAISEPDIHRRILMLIAETTATAGNTNPLQLVAMSVAVVAVAALLADKAFGAVHHGALSSAIAGFPATALPLPDSVAVFLKRIAADAGGSAFLDRLEVAVSETAIPNAASRKSNAAKAKIKAQTHQTLQSPFAGFALLIPDIVRLGMHRHLGLNGLRQTILGIAEPEMRQRLEMDWLLLTLFPNDDTGSDLEFPPIPFSAIASIAPEARSLLTGREGADGWGDLLIASFASRLPGLRASSRGYLIRQFLAVPGRADITDDAIVVTLDGPALTIVLKMAGLSGDQMPVPFFGNRLLILKLGGGR
jgi:hypothetical protein